MDNELEVAANAALTSTKVTAIPSTETSAVQNKSVASNRINWSTGKNKRTIDRAVNEYQQPGTTLNKLSKKHGIPISTLHRAVNNNKTDNNRRGRKHNCDALLVHQSDEKVVVPMTTFAIEDAICTWQNEKRGEHAMNPRLKREIFVMLKSENKYMWPRNAGQLNGDEVIHIILHMGRHYAYVNANGPVLNYYDSGNAATTTRNKKRNSNADTMMREVGEQLNKNTKKQFQYLNIVKESPKQTNDLDCGVFALFFMECNMHGYTIKQQLTNNEISNYMGRLKLIEKREGIIFDYKAKNRLKLSEKGARRDRKANRIALDKSKEVYDVG